MNIILISGFFALTIMLTFYFAVKTFRQYGQSALDNMTKYGSVPKAKTIKISQRAELQIVARPSPASPTPSLHKSNAISYLQDQTVTNISAARPSVFRQKPAKPLPHAA